MLQKRKICIKDVFGFICFLILIGLGNFTSSCFGQIELSLDTISCKISPQMFGFNGRSTEGPSWEDPEFLRYVHELSPGTIRYPAGTQANYWDWRFGTFIAGSGKTSKYNITIPMFVNGLPEETGIIYVMNLARPTPATGIPLDAREEVLKSDSVLQLKINDMLEALTEFDQNGKLPFAIELGNEFYFDNEHAAIYAANPALYLNHAKKIAEAIKSKHPGMKIILITSKGGTTGRDYWNSAVFDTLGSDTVFRNMIHAVVQHHYINDNYGDPTLVTDLNTAKQAIVEGIMYTREKKSDYEMVPDGLRLWITEYGATKENADGTWASGLRGAAMTLSWMDLGGNIEFLNYHHITNEPDVINKTAMKSGPVGLSLGMLCSGARGKPSAVNIHVSNNPISTGTVEALHAYKFINDSEESLYILNLGENNFTNISINQLLNYRGRRIITRAWSTTPFQSPVYEDSFISLDSTYAGDRIEIKPFSVTLVTAQYESPTFGKRNEFTTSIKLYPSPFSEYFTIEIAEEMEECHMQIMDLSGNVKYISKLNAGTSYHAPSLSAGIYIVNLRSLDKSCNYKVVKLMP